MASRKLEVIITGDASSLNRALGQAGTSASGFGSKMAKAGKIAAVGLAGGIAIAAVALKKSADAALDAEKAQKRLDAAFRAANVSAKDRAEAMKAVSKTSNRAALDDEDLMDTLGRLTRVTGDARKAQQAMAVAADVARGRNLSLEASTKIVEKALLGNVGALKRIGIEIPKVTEAQDALRASNENATDAQKKAAKAADDTATRQAALAALQKQYAGAAEAYGNSSAGAQERFKVALENLQEAIGAKLLPVLTKLFILLSDLITWATVNWPRFEKAATDAYESVRKGAQQLIDYYNTNFKPAIENVIEVVRAIWSRFGEQITTIAKTYLSQLRSVIVAGLTIIKAVFEVFAALLRGDWSAAWNGIKTIVTTTLNLMVTTIKNVGTLMIAALQIVGKGLLTVLGTVAGQFVGLIRGGLNAVVSAINGLAGAAGRAASSFGQAIYNGIVGALKGLGGALVSLITAPINAILGKINGIRIPGFNVKMPGPIPDVSFAGVDPIPNIPLLARGGIVKSPTLAMIGEAGPEAVIPLRRGGMGGVINITVNGWVGNDQDIAARIQQELLRYGRRNPTIFTGPGITA